MVTIKSHCSQLFSAFTVFEIPHRKTPPMTQHHLRWDRIASTKTFLISLKILILRLLSQSRCVVFRFVTWCVYVCMCICRLFLLSVLHFVVIIREFLISMSQCTRHCLDLRSLPARGNSIFDSDHIVLSARFSLRKYESFQIIKRIRNKIVDSIFRTRSHKLIISLGDPKSGNASNARKKTENVSRRCEKPPWRERNRGCARTPPSKQQLAPKIKRTPCPF